MNRAEAIAQMGKLKEEMEKLNTIIEAPLTQRWRAFKGDKYFFVNARGEIGNTDELGYMQDDIHFDTGNYFKSLMDAKASNLYTMSGEYDYWIPGVTPCKPSFQPKNFEYYYNNEWKTGDQEVRMWRKQTYRWKRSEQ